LHGAHPAHQAPAANLLARTISSCCSLVGVGTQIPVEFSLLPDEFAAFARGEKPARVRPPAARSPILCQEDGGISRTIMKRDSSELGWTTGLGIYAAVSETRGDQGTMAKAH